MNEKTAQLHSNSNIWSQIILVLISLAFLLSDWTVFYSSFGDFILILAATILVVMGEYKFKKNQMFFVVFIVCCLIISSVLNYFFNNYWFDTFRALISSAKLLFYTISLILFYNYINKFKLKKRFLEINNGIAVLAVIIGVLLTLFIYLEFDTIYQFIWTFTRSDSRSYYFGTNENIVRTRSLFSEPAHFGYYLNAVFFANLFDNKKNNYIVLLVLGLGIVLTLSYSMYAVFGVTFFSYILIKFIKKELSWSHWYWSIILTIGLVMIYLWDFIEVAILQRTYNILAGEDNSANIRLFGAWDYVENSRLIYGNGIGHTPPITNVFAYALSDFGLIGFVPYSLFTVSLIFYHVPVFVLFVSMNASKGGYLNPSYWIFLLLIFLYGTVNKNDSQYKNV